MTENLLQKLEEKLQKLDEKMMTLLAQIEDSHKEIQRLTHENSLMRMERENHAKKLTDLISLLDTISAADNMISNVITPIKPVLVQENLA